MQDSTELQTVLCRIEGAINARPLSALSEDIDDVRPLAPKDFLQGTAQGYDQMLSLISTRLRVTKLGWVSGISSDRL